MTGGKGPELSKGAIMSEEAIGIAKAREDRFAGGTGSIQEGG